MNQSNFSHLDLKDADVYGRYLGAENGHEGAISDEDCENPVLLAAHIERVAAKRHLQDVGQGEAIAKRINDFFESKVKVVETAIVNMNRRDRRRRR